MYIGVPCFVYVYVCMCVLSCIVWNIVKAQLLVSEERAFEKPCGFEMFNWNVLSHMHHGHSHFQEGVTEVSRWCCEFLCVFICFFFVYSALFSACFWGKVSFHSHCAQSIVFIPYTYHMNNSYAQILSNNIELSILWGFLTEKVQRILHLNGICLYIWW